MLELRLSLRQALMEDSGKENSSVVTDGSASGFTTSKTSSKTETAVAAVSEEATEPDSNATMGELGPPKDLLRERIRNKRAIEGLDDIPSEELFAKKPKYDLSQEEKERLLERRKRNKEAAEKSRKKKKDEFEKLQSENDQLAQDKCEMAAMIEKLKKDLQNTTKENQDLKGNLDGLKRWIGKKAQMLGLVEPGSKVDKADVTNAGKSVLTRGDPSLQSADNLQDKVGQVMKIPSPPSPPLSPSTVSLQPIIPSPPPAHQNGVFKVPSSPPQQPTRSFTPPDDQFQPVAICTHPRSVTVAQQKGHGLQTPWLVDQPAHKARKQPEDLRTTTPDENDVVITSVVTPSRVSSPQQTRTKTAVSLLAPHQRSEDQQIIFLPKDTFLVMDGSPYSFTVQQPGQQIAVVSPNMVNHAVDESTEKVTVVEGQHEVPTTPAQVALPVSAYATLPASFAPQVVFSAPMSIPISLPVSGSISVSGKGEEVYRGDAIYTLPSRPQVTEIPSVVAQTPIPTTQLDLHSDPKVMTAIESLLKLGFKVLPGQAPVSGAPAVTTKAVDHSFYQVRPLPSTRSA